MPPRGHTIFQRRCPARAVLGRMTKKWVSLIVCALADGPLRFSDLAGRIEGVSEKMLAQTLKELERDGLATRTAAVDAPPRVDYALTSLGQSLVGPLRELCRWCEHHQPAIEAARRHGPAREAS